MHVFYALCWEESSAPVFGAKVNGVLCAISGRYAREPFGYILGTAAGVFALAAESAFFEAFRNFAHFNANIAMSVEQFWKKAKGRVDFTDHGNLALNIAYAKTALDPLFLQEGLSVEEGIDLSLESHLLKLIDTPFAEAPIAVCRVASKSLQDLYTGETTDKKINYERLNQFCLAHSRPLRITDLPHPFN